MTDVCTQSERMSLPCQILLSYSLAQLMWAFQISGGTCIVSVLTCNCANLISHKADSTRASLLINHNLQILTSNQIEHIFRNIEDGCKTINDAD